jgi:hypothetical protein
MRYKCATMAVRKGMNMTDPLKQVSRFQHLSLARSYANRCHKLHLILLGDDDRFWVGTPRITEALRARGYEYA